MKRQLTDKEYFYNNFSQHWESQINNFETENRLHVVFSELLGSKDLRGKKFLEVGSGLGYFSKQARDRKALVTAVDIGPELVKITGKRVKNGNFLVASADSLPFKADVFDVVLCTEVIEHVRNQKKALAELVRVTKKNGVLVLTSPNKLFKPLFDFLSHVNIRPYHGLEKWFFAEELRRMVPGKLLIEKKIYFNFFINYGLRLRKTNKK